MNEVAETAGIGTSVGITAQAADLDATNSTITYTLDDDAGGRFAIDGVSGAITVNAALDFETNTSHNVIVRASSSDGSFNTQNYTINVTDVSEFSATPVVDNDAAVDTVLENAAIGTSVGVTAFSDDFDATDTITYSLDDNDGGRFAIDSSTGIVTVAGGDRPRSRRRESLRSPFAPPRPTVRSNYERSTSHIGDVDEFDVGAVSDSDGATNQVNENATVGTVVGVVAFGKRRRRHQQHDHLHAAR